MHKMAMSTPTNIKRQTSCSPWEARHSRCLVSLWICALLAASTLVLISKAEAAADAPTSVSICFISPGRRCPAIGWKLVQSLAKNNTCSAATAAQGNTTLLNELFGGLYNVTVNTSSLQVFQDTPTFAIAQGMRDRSCDVIIGPGQSTVRDNTFLDDALPAAINHGAPSTSVVIDYSSLASSLSDRAGYPQYFSLLPQNIPSVLAEVLTTFGWFNYALVQALQLPPVDLNAIDPRFEKTLQLTLRNQLSSSVDDDVLLLRNFLQNSFALSNTRVAVIYLGDRFQTFANSLITHILTPNLYTEKVFVFVVHDVNCAVFSSVVGSFCISSTVSVPSFMRTRGSLNVALDDPLIATARFPKMGDYLVMGGYSPFAIDSIRDRLATPGTLEKYTYSSARIAIPEEDYMLHQRTNMGVCAPSSGTSCAKYLIAESTDIPSTHNVFADMMCNDATVVALNYLSNMIRKKLPLNYASLPSSVYVPVSSGLLLAGADVAFNPANGQRLAARMALWNILPQGKLLQVGALQMLANGTTQLLPEELGSIDAASSTTVQRRGFHDESASSFNDDLISAGGVPLVFTLGEISSVVPSNIVPPHIPPTVYRFELLYAVLAMLGFMVLLWLGALTYRRLARVWRHNENIRKRQGGFAPWGGGARGGGEGGRMGMLGGVGSGNRDEDDDIPENVFIYVDIAHYESLASVFPGDMDKMVSSVGLVLKRARDEAIQGAARWREMTARHNAQIQGESLLSSSAFMSTDYLDSDGASLHPSTQGRGREGRWRRESESGSAQHVLSYDTSTGFGPKAPPPQQQQSTKSGGTRGNNGRTTVPTSRSEAPQTAVDSGVVSLLRSFLDGLVGPRASGGGGGERGSAVEHQSGIGGSVARGSLPLRRSLSDNPTSVGSSRRGAGKPANKRLKWVPTLPPPSLEIVKHIQNRTTVLTTNSIEAALLFSVAAHILLAEFKWELVLKRDSARLLPAFYSYYDSLLFREVKLRQRLRAEEAWGTAAPAGGRGVVRQGDARASAVALGGGRTFYPLNDDSTNAIRTNGRATPLSPTAAAVATKNNNISGGVSPTFYTTQPQHHVQAAEAARCAITGPKDINANAAEYPIHSEVAHQAIPNPPANISLSPNNLGRGPLRLPPRLTSSAELQQLIALETNGTNKTDETLGDNSSLKLSANTRSTSTWGPDVDRAEIEAFLTTLHHNTSSSSTGPVNGSSGTDGAGVPTLTAEAARLLSLQCSPEMVMAIGRQHTQHALNVSEKSPTSNQQHPNAQQQLPHFEQKEEGVPPMFAASPPPATPPHQRHHGHGVAVANLVNAGIIRNLLEGATASKRATPLSQEGHVVEYTTARVSRGDGEEGGPYQQHPLKSPHNISSQHGDRGEANKNSKSSSSVVKDVVGEWNKLAKQRDQKVFGGEEIYNNPEAVILILQEAKGTCLYPGWHPLAMDKVLMDEFSSSIYPFSEDTSIISSETIPAVPKHNKHVGGQPPNRNAVQPNATKKVAMPGQPQQKRSVGSGMGFFAKLFGRTDHKSSMPATSPSKQGNKGKRGAKRSADAKQRRRGDQMASSSSSSMSTHGSSSAVDVSDDDTSVDDSSEELVSKANLPPQRQFPNAAAAKPNQPNTRPTTDAANNVNHRAARQPTGQPPPATAHSAKVAPSPHELQGVRVRIGMAIGPYVTTISKTGKEEYFGAPLNAAASLAQTTKPGRTVIVGLLASDRYAFDHVSFSHIGDFKVLGSYNISGCAAVQELLEVVAAPFRRFAKSSPLEEN